MKKFNLSEIMKKAWEFFRMAKKWSTPKSFSWALRQAWAEAKEAAREFSGIVRNVQVGGTLMHPVLVDIDMDELCVTGNTFPVRQMMRDLGLAWNKDNKAWTGSRETLNALCVKYA